MKVAPAINSRWHPDRLEIFDDINIGVGTALGSKGLIVPVLRQVQRLSCKGLRPDSMSWWKEPAPRN
jgi:2-oxoglutarate dehydrogenase E2 component (dihydrolipoamide succinyltransferase)